MNPRQKELVQSSFAKVAPIADQAADLFYNRLFEIDPSLRPMFPGKHERAKDQAHANADYCG
jgi:hemoglobin-like flavoprotein